MFGSQLQILLVVFEAEDSDFIVNAALIPVTIATLIGAAQFCKREKTKSLITMMVRFKLRDHIFDFNHGLTITIVLHARHHGMFRADSLSNAHFQ